MKHFVTLAVLVFVLAGCTAAQHAALETGVANKRAYNDQKRDFALRAVCDISLGAFYRLPPDRRRAVAALCGAEPLAGQ